MSNEYSVSAKVYTTHDGVKLSVLDLLGYFEKYGVMRVSDLHIKVADQPAFRIDGEIVKLKGDPLTVEMAKQLICPLLSQKCLDELNTEFNTDTSYKLGNLQFRINAFIENEGPAVAIRALSNKVPEIEDLGFPNNTWEDIITLKEGLVLVTGITGAGKSTTIASLINRINLTDGCRIITLEDPIEYLYPKKMAMISQREVGRDVKSFYAGLKALMREDPDIVFVGEMRDPETINMTLMAAETGHLVFSTLHTRDTTGTITRILDYFPSNRQQEVRNQLSLSLAYIISQKLVPQKSGRGRIIAMEILNNNLACANLIRAGKFEQIYSQLQTKVRDNPEEKMITFEKHLSILVKTGKVDILEAQKWVGDLKCFIDYMKESDEEKKEKKTNS